MTACVDNKEKKGGAAKAVSATLAGVLAVGMVPAVAFAADEAPEEEAGAELLAVSDGTAWENGKVTKATDAEGKNIEDLTDVEFVANGEAQYVIPTEFTPELKSGVAVSEDDGYNFTYAKGTINDDGSFSISEYVDEDEIVDPGEYGVLVADKATETGKTSKTYFTFTIVADSLEGATLFEVDPEDETDTSDTEFVWNAKEWTIDGKKLGVALDGKALKAGEDYTTTDVEYYQNNVKMTGKPTASGDYVAVVKGTGVYAGQSVKIPFTIAKLDLAKADIELVTDGTGATAYRNFNAMPEWIKVTDGSSSFTTAARVEIDADRLMNNEYGAYVFTIVPAENEKDITGTGTVTLINAKTDLTANFEYDGEAWPTDAYKVNHALTEDKDGWKAEDFDISAITLEDSKGKDVAFDIVVTDEDGNEFDDSDVTKPGKWTLTATVDSAACDYEYYGEVEIDIEVIDGTIAEDQNIFVQYDGNLISGTTESDPEEIPYDGTDLMEAIAITVKVDDATLTEGTDYTVEYLDADGEEVTEMVNAGKYQIVVKGAGYELKAPDTTWIEITAVDASDLRIDPDTFAPYAGENAYAYTGSDIVPAIQYFTGEYKDDVEKPENKIYAELPAEAYTLSYQKLDEATGDYEDVESINEAGTYKVKVEDLSGDAAEEPAGINWTVATKEFDVEVSDEPLFSDVPVSEWYTPYVYAAAKSQGEGHEAYMSGYMGTDLFGPNNNLLRGEAATILFRMAGGTQEDIYDGLYGNASDIFGDVSATLFYNTPIAWAYQTGIVTGYEDGTGNFGPNDSITREQFCTMLYRYAKVTNQLGDKAEADLSVYPDAGSVSGFAQEAVEWAVANEIFGGDVVLRPGETISRAEVAKMITVFQPEALTAPNLA